MTTQTYLYVSDIKDERDAYAIDSNGFIERFTAKNNFMPVEDIVDVEAEKLLDLFQSPGKRRRITRNLLLDRCDALYQSHKKRRKLPGVPNESERRQIQQHLDYLRNSLLTYK